MYVGATCISPQHRSGYTLCTLVNSGQYLPVYTCSKHVYVSVKMYIVQNMSLSNILNMGEGDHVYPCMCSSTDYVSVK